MATINFLQKSSDGSAIAGLTDSTVNEISNVLGVGSGTGSYVIEFQNAGSGNIGQFKFANGGNKFQFLSTSLLMFEIDSDNSEQGINNVYGLKIEDAGIRHSLKARDLNPSFLAIGTQNLGVGTQTPGSKLDVDGTFNVSGDATIPTIAGNTAVSGNVTATDVIATG